MNMTVVLYAIKVYMVHSLVYKLGYSEAVLPITLSYCKAVIAAAPLSMHELLYL